MKHKKATNKYKSGTTGQSAAAIQFQILQLDMKLTIVETQIKNLTTEQTNLNTYLGNWDTQKEIYSNSEILSEVVIVNVFEGVCADKMQSNITESVSEMDKTYSGVSELNENVAAQISRLNQYVSDINLKLTSLRNKLDTI